MNLPAFLTASVIGAANAPASIIIPSSPESRIILQSVIWSYSKNPSNGKLIASGGSASVEFDITDQGPGSMDLSFYICNAGKNLAVTLGAGGPGVIGKLNIAYSTRRF
jgi:hypothetical protein